MRLALRIVGWTIAFLITLEVCARIDDAVTRGAPFIGSYDNEILYTFDNLGKTGKPHARYLKWALNAEGFRGPELHEGRERILCLGSSETFGLYEQEDGEWPRQLEHILNQRSGRPSVDVVNAAYPGQTLATLLKRLPGWLTELRPSAVVIYPSLAAYISLPPEPRRPETAPPRPFFESRIVERIRVLLKASVPETVQNRIRDFQTGRDARNMEVMRAIPEANVLRFRQELEEIIDLVERSGARTVLVTHATLFGNEVRPEDEPVLRAWRKFYPMLAEAGFLDMERRLNQVIRDVASERGVVLVDAAQQMPTGHKFFVEFVHFTDEGANSLAKLVAGRLNDPATVGTP